MRSYITCLSVLLISLALNGLARCHKWQGFLLCYGSIVFYSIYINYIFIIRLSVDEHFFTSAVANSVLSHISLISLDRLLSILLNFSKSKFWLFYLLLISFTFFLFSLICLWHKTSWRWQHSLFPTSVPLTWRPASNYS